MKKLHQSNMTQATLENVSLNWTNAPFTQEYCAKTLSKTKEIAWKVAEKLVSFNDNIVYEKWKTVEKILNDRKAKRQDLEIQEIQKKAKRKRTLNAKKPKTTKDITLKEELKAAELPTNPNELSDLGIIDINTLNKKLVTQEDIDNSKFSCENLTIEDWLHDFANMIAEWNSISGTYFLEEFNLFVWELNKNNIKTLLKKIDNRVNKYDEGARRNAKNWWYYRRVADYNYKFEDDKLILEYATCNDTLMRTIIDFDKQDSVVVVEGNISSIQRRLQATGAASEYHQHSIDLLSKFYKEKLRYIEEINKNSRGNYTLGISSFINEEWEFSEHIYLTIPYQSFYGYTKDLGLSQNSNYEPYDFVEINKDNNPDQTIDDYINKTERLLEEKERLKKLK